MKERHLGPKKNSDMFNLVILHRIYYPLFEFPKKVFSEPVYCTVYRSITLCSLSTFPSSPCIFTVFPLSSFRRFPFTFSSFFVQVRHRAGAFLLSRDRLRPQIPPPKGHCLQASRTLASSRLIILCCFAGT